MRSMRARGTPLPLARRGIWTAIVAKLPPLPLARRGGAPPKADGAPPGGRPPPPLPLSLARRDGFPSVARLPPLPLARRGGGRAPPKGKAPPPLARSAPSVARLPPLPLVRRDSGVSKGARLPLEPPLAGRGRTPNTA